MAILRALDGTFYEVPDDALDQYAIPADELKAKLENLEEELPETEPPPTEAYYPPSPTPLVNVQVFGSVPEMGTTGPPAAEPEVVPHWRLGGGWRAWSQYRHWNHACPTRYWRLWQNRPSR